MSQSQADRSVVEGSSLRLRLIDRGIRLLVRRRDWGEGAALARRARRLFGAPRWYQIVRSFGVQIAPSLGDPPGEWLTPKAHPRGTILYLHGGGYVSCNPGTHRPITAALARLATASVFVPDYRLAPEHPYPAALDDAEQAYLLLLSRGLDPNSIVVAGDSAGGGLAMALLLRLREGARPLPAGAILLSPWTDLTGSGASIRTNDGKCAMLRPENMGAFAACYAPADLWRDPGVSPLFGRLGGLPPIHLQVGETELLRDDAVRLHEGVRAAGGLSELLVYTGGFHVWHMLDGIVPEARAALRRAAEFAGAIFDASRARTVPGAAAPV